MKRGPIWKITVPTTAEAADAVAELIVRAFGESASTYTDAESARTTVAIYCAAKPLRLERRCAELRSGLLRIKDFGLDVGSGTISVRKIRREDWAESWKRHFKPIEVGRTLLVKPSWSKRRPKRNQAVVVLDPGLSFGTGQHPTTGFCLQELARRRRAGDEQSFLDIGTGSGILAIAAAKLGYLPIRAFDFDTESIRVATTNARHNHVLQKIDLHPGDITKVRASGRVKYDFICANLISTLLIAERKRIVNMLADKSILVLAGILKAEFNQVQRAYEICGLKLIAAKTQKEWRSGTFVKERSNGGSQVV